MGQGTCPPDPAKRLIGRHDFLPMPLVKKLLQRNHTVAVRVIQRVVEVYEQVSISHCLNYFDVLALHPHRPDAFV